MMGVGLAVVAVFIIMLLMSANIQVTLLVMICVIIVDVDLFGLIYYWDLELNNVAVLNLVLAIGLSVDYSAHIAHAYLASKPPEDKIYTREARTKAALGSIGSSVFHGAFSTFLAIAVLAPSGSYIFKVFFRMWFGIIVFGLANGLILLPVLLSIAGPVDVPEKLPVTIETRQQTHSD